MNWNFTAQNSLGEFISEAEKNASKYGYAPQKVSFADRMKKLRESLSEISTSVFVKVWGNEKEFQSFLTVVEHLNLSAADDSHGKGIVYAALVYAQRPEARRLLTFDEWSRKGVRIKKGSRGIDIFIPSTGEKDGKKTTFFNPTKVWDVEQTTAQFRPVQIGLSDLKVVSCIMSIMDFATDYSDLLPDGVDACYIPRINTVWVRDGQSMAAMRTSLLIEYGHYQLSKAKDYDRTPEANFIAYTSAYLLSRHFGLEMEAPPQEAFPPTVDTPGKIKEILASTLSVSTRICSKMEKELGGLYSVQQDSRDEDMEP